MVIKKTSTLQIRMKTGYRKNILYETLDYGFVVFKDSLLLTYECMILLKLTSLCFQTFKHFSIYFFGKFFLDCFRFSKNFG